MICRVCGVEQLSEARFCEDCGSPLERGAGAGSGEPGQIRLPAPAPRSCSSACGQCGAGPGAMGADGFCTHCGCERIDVSRNHVEVVISPRLAGVSDIGLKHFRNEDALGLAGGPGGEAMVVCDGVSCSQNPDLASAVAVEAAMKVVQARSIIRRRIMPATWSPPHCKRRKPRSSRFPSPHPPMPTPPSRRSSLPCGAARA